MLCGFKNCCVELGFILGENGLTFGFKGYLGQESLDLSQEQLRMMGIILEIVPIVEKFSTRKTRLKET